MFTYFILDKNIDEVLHLPDLSLLPQSFLTEIEQDEAYATILAELQKKQSYTKARQTNALHEDDHQQSMTPYFTSSVDDNHIDVIDEISTITLDKQQNEQLNDGYDTDIEIGRKYN